MRMEKSKSNCESDRAGGRVHGKETYPSGVSQPDDLEGQEQAVGRRLRSKADGLLCSKKDIVMKKAALEKALKDLIRLQKHVEERV
jgi:hypothetical protein